MDSDTIRIGFDQHVSARKTHDGRMQSIVDYVDPTRYDFFDPMLTSASVQWEHPQIYDNTATVYYKLLAARLKSNMMNSVTRWYNMRFRNDDDNENAEATEWLEDCVSRIWHQQAESNFNEMAGENMRDNVLLGTSMAMQEPKGELVWEGIEYTALPIMDSYFDMGPDGVPYRIYRKLRYTREDLERRFDLPEGYSLDDPEEGSIDAKIEVIFCVYEREEINQELVLGEILTPEKRPFGYKYIIHSDATELEEGGYYHFPALVTRWDKVAGTQWGSGPVADILENIIQLNTFVAQKSESGAKALDPPYKTTERGILGDLDSNAGGITVVAEMDELLPLLDQSATMAGMNAGDQIILHLQATIRAALYGDKLELKESPAMTATEVTARLEEAFRLLADVVGRIQDEFQSPALQFLFNTMLRMKGFLPMPESLQDTDLDIIFTGPIARALQAEQADGIIHYLTLTAELAEIYPDMLDIPDVDVMSRKLAQLKGVPTDNLHTQEEVDAIRQARAEQQQQMQEAQNIQMGGEALKSAGEGAMAAQEAGLDPQAQ